MLNFKYNALLLLVSLSLLSNFSLAKAELEPPTFSHDSGFYPKEFKLTLSHPDKDVTIYYTLDGSDPDPDNLEGKTFRYKNEYAQPPATQPKGEFLYQEYKTYKYSKPIKIVDRTYEPDRLSQISTTFDTDPSYYFPKPVRADTWLNRVKEVINGWIFLTNKGINQLVRNINKYIFKESYAFVANKQYISEFSYTLKQPIEYLFKGTPVKSFALDKQGNKSKTLAKVLFIGDQNQFSLPIINITVPEKELFDYEQGVLVAGSKYDNWLLNYKTAVKDILVSYGVRGWGANYQVKGKQKKADFLLLDKEYQINSKISIGIHGSGSRRYGQKPIRLYFKESNQDLFNYQEVLVKQRYILRNGGSQQAEKARYLDGALQSGLAGLNVGTQRYEPSILFINGEYYGLTALRDRRDSYLLQRMFNLPSKKVDHFKGKNVLIKGSANTIDELVSFFTNKNQSNHFFNRLKELIDEKSFIDYYALQIFIGNKDWPANNLAYWRYRGKINSDNNFTDGRWRWLVYDLDTSALKKHTNRSYLNQFRKLPIHTVNNNNWSKFILGRALADKDFRIEFITRFSDLINSYFTSNRMTKIISTAHKQLEPDMQQHIERWSRPHSMQSWNSYTQDLLYFFQNRPKHQWQHLQEFFELDDFYQVQVDVSKAASGKVKLNTLTLGDDPNKDYQVTDTPLFFPWQGQYFQNLPLTLEAVPAEGYQFSHWKIQGAELTAEEAKQQKLVLKPTQNLKVIAVMDKL